MKIERNVIQTMVEHAEREAPIEACGYLAGTEGLIGRSFPMTNADGREDHFSFVPEEQFTVVRAARDEGLRLLAVYHSHPATPARPSEEDIRLAYDPDLLYVIVSLKDGGRTVKAFHIRDARVEEVPLIIEEVL